MRLSIIILSFFLTSVFCPAPAKPQTLDGFFTALESDKNINGNVLAAENGKVLYKKSFGFADFENKKLNSGNTRLQFDSISKTITAVAVLQLKEQGKLKLDDKFVKYFSGFPYPTVSIRRMLSHTSGLPDGDLFARRRTRAGGVARFGTQTIRARRTENLVGEQSLNEIRAEDVAAIEREYKKCRIENKKVEIFFPNISTFLELNRRFFRKV